MSAAPIVQVKEGKLKGFIAKNHDGGEYFAFRGIPFAEPPIGQLRFKDPKKPKPWSGIRDARESGRKSLQYDAILGGGNTGDEDCLYLDVATASLSGKKPVMVWIHGGGFVLGGPHTDVYGPDYLIKHDIVYVAIAYRLGCLGFLNLDLPEASGNQGLKDQVAALKWVKENIEAFGGDAGNITIFGESAGSASVHYLTLSPLAKGLFHKAIAQSGMCANPWAFEEKPGNYAFRLIECIGKKAKDSKDALKILMNASSTELIEGQKKMGIGEINLDISFNFVPSLDTKSSEPFMLQHPRELFKKVVDVPLILGYTSDEGILALSAPNVGNLLAEAKLNFINTLAHDLKSWPLGDIEKIADSVKKFYFGEREMSLKMEKIQWSKLKGDTLFINEIQQVADLQMDKSTSTYLYKFSYRPEYPTYGKFMKTDLEGACHGDDIGALFHSSLFSKEQTLKKGTRDRLTMERMTQMWTNFAKTGNPTPETDTEITHKWEPLKKGEKNYLEINDDLVPGQNPDEKSWNFWKNILKKLERN
ncbi:juvenile hormone esterase-like isoform X1 [Venturia canescens]|uniref:juvenile hormone esterase-like isoform X1 n=1 Tax=Venturia canescens TaxID=32260 RepID=UPI001C9C93C4|nr:juvenile hormone esterase-like isoform X1 [Venturia canescens]